MAAIVFGPRLGAALRYADLLAGPGVQRGLVGPREVPRLWQRHLLNCAVVAAALPPGAAVVDVGSGAGLPGLVLALCRPDLAITLCEPLLRRTRFLTEAVELLELDNVEVMRSRAEDLVSGVPTDVVTARAVAPLARLAGWTLPLLRPGGRLLAIKGAAAGDELAALAPRLPQWGARSWRLLELGAGIVDPPTRVVEIQIGPLVRQAGRSTRRRDGRHGR